MTTYDLDHLEKTALAMTKKNWSDQASQDFDDAFRPAVAMQLVGDLRTARRNEGHNREAWGKTEARLLSRDHEIARLAPRVAELERWWYAVPEEQRFAIMSDDSWRRHEAAGPK